MFWIGMFTTLVGVCLAGTALGQLTSIGLNFSDNGNSISDDLAATDVAGAPGYACLTSGDCKHWCRVGFSDCGAGKTCTGFSAPNQLFVDGLEYGVCP